MKQGLTSNQLKLIAILVMTIDHLAWTFFPGYDTRWFVLLAHIVGRLTAPIIWFFLSEGYHHTRSVNHYARRLFSLAAVCLLTFPADWSCVATMAVLFPGENHGNFRAQVIWLMVWSAVYAAVYFCFLDRVYGLIQLFTCLSIPLLQCYNGQRDRRSSMRRFFYVYYPAHQSLLGLLRFL